MSANDKEKRKQKRAEAMEMTVVYGPPEPRRIKNSFIKKIKDKVSGNSDNYPDNYAGNLETDPDWENTIMEELYGPPEYFSENPVIQNEPVNPGGSIHHCPYCGKDVPPDSNFCNHCGKALKLMYDWEVTTGFCNHCGADIPMTFSYCPYCGKRAFGPMNT